MSGTIRLPSGDIITTPTGNGSLAPVGGGSPDTTVGAVGAGGHLQSTATTKPGVAAGANNGTSPPAPSVTGNDTRGTITFGSGASPAIGAQVVVTFATPFASAPVLTLTATNAATAALGLHVTAVTASGFTVSTASAPAASQGAATYAAAFQAIG